MNADKRKKVLEEILDDLRKLTSKMEDSGLSAYKYMYYATDYLAQAIEEYDRKDEEVADERISNCNRNNL